MLLDTYTLSVDATNDASHADKIITKVSTFENRSLYKGPGHSTRDRELFGFYRTAPKKAGNFMGVERCAFKCTLDIDVEGVDQTTTITSPIIADVSFSIPVGATSAQVLEIRQRVIAVLELTTLMDKLQSGEI